MELINEAKLKSLCEKHTKEVSLNGLMGFTQNVIDADELFEEIHLCSDISKETFIDNINSARFMSPNIEQIFKSVKHQGVFKVKGFEPLGNHSYIECKNLKFLK